MLPEEAVEIGGIPEAEAVGDVAYAPIGMVQKQFDFAGQALGNGSCILTTAASTSATPTSPSAPARSPALTELLE